LLQDHSQKIVVYSQVSDAVEAVEALDHCNFAAIVRFSFIILFYFIYLFICSNMVQHKTIIETVT